MTAHIGSFGDALQRALSHATDRGSGARLEAATAAALRKHAPTPSNWLRLRSPDGARHPHRDPPPSSATAKHMTAI